MRPSTSERHILEKKYEGLIEVSRSLNRRLVSFQGNKDLPFYRWFSFKEGFSPQMVRAFLGEYRKPTGRVLDPFSGSCTTLFGAQEMGWDSYGIEVMPIGEFVLESRRAAVDADLDKLSRVLKRLRKLDFSQLPTNRRTAYVHIAITAGAFSADTEKKLNGFLNYVETRVQDEDIKQILRLACFCILERISYTRKDGQYLRWDQRSKKGRSKFNKGKVYGFEEALFEQLDKIVSDISSRRLEFGERSGKLELRTGSCLAILPTLRSSSFDLIITSPPYCNRYDYTRTYALELVYLGLNEEDVKQLRQDLLSCTVENKEKADALEQIYREKRRYRLFKKAEESFKANKALQEVLGILEEYRNKGKLNNPGIYRMVKNYFYEHSFVILEMARLLRKGGRVYYVNDNVRYAGETIPVDLILSDFAVTAGLRVKNIFRLGSGKGNSSQQMGAHGREELRKCVYLWEK